MNPWRQNLQHSIQTTIRLLLWLSTAVNLFLLSFFSVYCLFNLLFNLTKWLRREVFTGKW